MNPLIRVRQIRTLLCIGIPLFSLGAFVAQSAIADQQVSTYCSTLSVAISTGFNFAGLPSYWITNFGMGGALVSGDFNGDGATDIAAIGDPCPTERARLQELQNELRQLSQIPGVKAEIKGVAEHNQQVLQRWHRDHDAEVNQLTTRLASPQCRLNSVRVALSTGHSFNPSADLWMSNFVAPDAVLTGAVLTGDFNGDGKTDIAVYDVAVKGWHVALSTGHSFDPSAGFWIRGFGRPGIMLTGDFNGDGKTDIAAVGDPCEFERAQLQALQDDLRGLQGPGGPADVKARLIEQWHEQHDVEVNQLTKLLASAQCPLSAVHMALSTGHSFDPSAGLWMINFGTPGAMLPGDFDGDGKADIAEWVDASTTEDPCAAELARVKALEGELRSLQTAGGPPDVRQRLIEQWHARHDAELAQLRTRLASPQCATTTTPSAWRVALSTGHSFDLSAGPWITNFGSAGTPLVGDFNGDGKADIAGWNDAEAAWHVALSTGNNFNPGAGLWITNFGAPGAVLAGDFNGDGNHRTDLAAFKYNLAKQPILTTTYNNAAYNTSSPTWARDVCGGETIGLDTYYEWTQVFNPHSETDDDMAGLSGVAVFPELSNDDLPFTHPFGYDYEFYVAPDQAYRFLLGPDNISPDDEYKTAKSRAVRLGLWVPKGTLGVETDQDLVPYGYRIREGDRVAIFGRWISDCGHNPFHTEIHPPLLMVTARPPFGPSETESTSVYIISRPWLVGQTFEGDNQPFGWHMLHEVIKTQLLIPLSTRVEAHARILKPFSAPHLINFVVKPPTARLSPNDKLIVSFHFTVRHGVVVQVYQTAPDAVGVLISMNDRAYTMGSLPHKNDWDIPVDDLRDNSSIIRTIQLTDKEIAAAVAYAISLGANPTVAAGFAASRLLTSWFVSRDFLADRYDAPDAPGWPPSQTTTMPVKDLVGNTPYWENATQPFPVYGQMSLTWERHPCPTCPTGGNNGR